MSAPTVLRYVAFTHAGTGGNPAGVVLDAGELDDAARLEVAARLGYSETAFVEPTDAPGVHRVRYFSPLAEVAFCGHATIATAVALAERDGPGRVELATAVGSVPVETRRTADGLVATLTSVETSTEPVDDDALAAALAALRWTSDDLDPRYPVHVAYAGEHHLVVVLRSRDRLAALDYDLAALGAVMAAHGWLTVHAAWPQDPTTFLVREPFPPGGVVEDPATGAAAAAFGGYLRDLGLVEVPATVTIHQGVDMGRPCDLLVDVTQDRRVRVTGAAAPIGD